MKLIIKTVACVVTCAMPASAQEFSDGMSAYNNGDYEAAVEIWRPLAE
jgi:hypothetical protein